MTRGETARLLALVKAAFPLFRLPDADAELDLMVGVWQAALADLPWPVVERAFVDYHRGREVHPPSAGQLRHLAIDRSRLVPSGEDAYTLVLRHIRATSYVSPAPLEAPRPVLEAVEAMGGIGRLRRSERPEQDRADFLRIYATYADRARRDLHGGALALEQQQLSALEAD